MRTRTDGSIVRQLSSAKTTYCNGNVLTVSYSSPLTKSGSMKTTMDMVVKDFKRQSALGKIFVNPATFIDETYVNSPGQQTATYTPACSGTSIRKDEWQNYLAKLQSGVGPDLMLLDGDIVIHLITEAYTKAIAAAGAPELEGLVNLAELPRLLSDLRGCAQALEQIYRRAHREWYDWEMKQRTKTGYTTVVVPNIHAYIASNWLRFRYAFLPIFKDAMSAFEQFKGPIKPERETFRAFGGTNNQRTFTTRYSGGHFHADFTQYQSANLAVRAGILRQSYPGSVLDPYGISLASIDDTIWEVIPYSFIVDWFANVGEYLRTMSPVVGYSGLGSWHVLEYTYETVWDVQYTPKNVSGFTYAHTPSSGQRIRSEKIRIPGGPVGLVLRPFRVREVWQKRIADVVAMVVTAISGGKPTYR